MAETSGKQQQEQKLEGDKEDDINNFWPVFGRENQQNKNKSFWQKGICKDLDIDEEDLLMEGVLSRIGRKKKVVKNYYYRLIGSYLCYYLNPDDYEYKGYLKLNQDVILERKQLNGKKENFFYLEFSTDSNMRKLYSKQMDQVKKWYSALRQKSILTGFKDQYKKVEMLGSGSFASVYKVLRVEDQQVFAAKIYHKEKLAENKYKDKFVQMMLNEYECLRQIENPYIGALYEIFQEQEYCAYVIEFVGGGEVYGKLKHVRKFNESQAAQILYYNTIALHCLHVEGYVHRDIKLENMMFVDKDSLKCKLIDFGFAEKINREVLLSKAGTPGFLPPELFKSQPYTEKGDIFSLGVILFCLVSGQSPFKGKTYKEVLDNNRRCHLDFSSSVWTNISENCKKLIKNMLEANPSNRCKTMDILKSPFIQQYIKSDIQTEILNLKSIKSVKSIKQIKKPPRKKKNINDGEESILSDCESQTDSQSYQSTTIIQFHGDTKMKSFYNRSLKSIKSTNSVMSMKKIQDRFSDEEEYSENVSNQSDHSFEGINLSQNYEQILKYQQNNKFVEDVEYSLTVGIDSHTLSNKLVDLMQPTKKFKPTLIKKPKAKGSKKKKSGYK